MEDLAPPLKCLIEIQSAIQNAEPTRSGFNRYLSQASFNDDFAPIARAFLFSWEQGHDWRVVLAKIKSSHRRALLELVALGLSGQSIGPHLEELRVEIVSSCELEVRHHIEMLPLRMLIPLLLFQFPAFLFLLFGPLLNHLISELNR